jgi:hypothetical protein
LNKNADGDASSFFNLEQGKILDIILGGASPEDTVTTRGPV